MLGLVLLNDAKNQISKHHETEARYQAITLAESSLDGLVSEDAEILEKLVRSSMPSDNYAYAALVRTDGKIITHTNLILIGETGSTVNTNAAGIAREVTYNQRPVLEVIYPALINKQLLANAHIGYYLDAEYILQSDTITLLVVVLLISLAIIFAATHFVTRSITVPIKHLTSNIAQVSLEKSMLIDQEIISRDDEIGELAQAFINMSDRLVSSHLELTESLIYNKVIVDSAIDGIVVATVDGEIKSINSAGEKIFGYSAEELIGNNVNILIPEGLRDKHNQYINQDNENHAEIIDSRIQVYGLRKDGSKVPLEISIGKIGAGNKTCYASTIRDISTRHEHEHALVLAKAAAEDGSRIKSEFLANISHELRTPMNGILGYLDLLSMDELAKDQEKYVNSATRSAEELLEIINNILEFTRMENHETELDISPFSLRDITSSLISEFKDIHYQNDINLNFKIDNNLPDQLIGDPSRIRSVIRHFMVNAYKFTTHGNISVNIDVLQQLQSKIEINIEVRDTGIGIEPINRNRIFELFTQADSSSTRRYGGTGIGLALCKKMVLSMSGEIGVDSEPGVGSTFWFSLQLDIAEDQLDISSSTRPSEPESREKEADYSPTKKNILVVEDNPFNQDLMREMLKTMNYQPDVAGNGQLALDALKKKDYDLILMDCQMPVMNGFEATVKIREMKTNHIPIVAVTAHALDGDRELCMKSGMDDYMSKPFSKADLEHMIHKWLS